MLSPLSIERRSVGDVTILELKGRLVVDEGDRFFRREVTALVEAGRRQLLLDLRQLTHIDSGGVGALVSSYLHVTRRGGQLKLLCPTERSCRVLRITHLITVFDVFNNEEEALRSFSGRAAAAT